MGSLKEFCGYSVENNILGWHSTAFIRLFIAFPSLLVEIIYYNIDSIETNSQYLMGIRYITSFIMITWILGWLSSLKNTLSFIFNKLNMFGLG